MATPSAHEFAAHFCQKTGLLAEIDKLNGRTGEGGLRKLWELSELSAGEFADEVAGFYDLPRATLQDLIGAEPRVQQFSRRFLRDMAIFPYQSGSGEPAVAIADPSDSASIQAAGIVMGTAPLIRIASFEDIGTALDQRLGEDQGPTVESAGSPTSAQDDDIDNLRDLASGAP
jgi:general secretion pathway protein E